MVNQITLTFLNWLVSIGSCSSKFVVNLVCNAIWSTCWVMVWRCNWFGGGVVVGGVDNVVVVAVVDAVDGWTINM